MANRPVFYVNPNPNKDVPVKNIEFEWFSGFLSDQNVHGRPSSVLTLFDGSMLVADDFADKIYRVTFH